MKRTLYNFFFKIESTSQSGYRLSVLLFPPTLYYFKKYKSFDPKNHEGDLDCLIAYKQDE